MRKYLYHCFLMAKQIYVVTTFVALKHKQSFTSQVSFKKFLFPLKLLIYVCIQNLSVWSYNMPAYRLHNFFLTFGMLIQPNNQPTVLREFFFDSLTLLVQKLVTPTRIAEMFSQSRIFLKTPKIP